MVVPIYEKSKEKKLKKINKKFLGKIELKNALTIEVSQPSDLYSIIKYDINQNDQRYRRTFFNSEVVFDRCFILGVSFKTQKNLTLSARYLSKWINTLFWTFVYRDNAQHWINYLIATVRIVDCVFFKGRCHAETMKRYCSRSPVITVFIYFARTGRLKTIHIVEETITRPTIRANYAQFLTVIRQKFYKL